VGGSLVGGSKDNTGTITSSRDMGPMSIGHDVVGGSLPSTGTSWTVLE